MAEHEWHTLRPEDVGAGPRTVRRRCSRLEDSEKREVFGSPSRGGDLVQRVRRALFRGGQHRRDRAAQRGIVPPSHARGQRGERSERLQRRGTGRRKKRLRERADVRFQYRLARELGKTRRQLLRELDAAELLDWQLLESLEPFGERRDDYRAALQTWTIVAALGAKRHDGRPWTLDDFRLQFDAKPAPPPRQQSAAEIERIIRMWVQGSNTVLRERRAETRRRCR